MLPLNFGRQDYKYTMAVTSSRTFTGTLPLVAYISSTIVGTWGNAFGDTRLGFLTDHGWQIQFVNKLDHTVESHFTEFRLPQLNLTVNSSGLGWLTPYDCDLTFPGASLITDCEAWTFSSSGFTLKILGSVIYSATGMISLSGTDFDPDHNCCYSYGSALPDLLGLPIVGCLSCPVGPPFSPFVETEVILNGTTVFGWEHNPGSGYIAEELDLVTTFGVPAVSGSCTCTDTLVLPTDPSNKCNAVTYSFNAHSHATRNFYANLNYYCDGVPSFSFPVYFYESIYELRTAKVYADPVIHTNRQTLEESGARCWASGTAPSYTTASSSLTRTHALARWFTDVSYVYQNKYCSLAEDSPPICIGEESVDPIPDCSSCEYDAYAGLSWLNTPCQSIEAMPWIIQENRGQYHRAVINSINGGDIIYRRADHTAPLPGWASEHVVTSTGDCKHPKMLLDVVTRRIWLDYLRGTTLYSIYSDNEGTSFTSGAIIATGVTHSSLVHSPQGDSWRTYV